MTLKQEKERKSAINALGFVILMIGLFGWAGALLEAYHQLVGNYTNHAFLHGFLSLIPLGFGKYMLNISKQ